MFKELRGAKIMGNVKTSKVIKSIMDAYLLEILPSQEEEDSVSHY